MDKGELTISFCPTAIMLADFFTKPLNGSLIQKFKSGIMGYEHISSLNLHKERVENS